MKILFTADIHGNLVHLEKLANVVRTQRDCIDVVMLGGDFTPKKHIMQRKLSKDDPDYDLVPMRMQLHFFTEHVFPTLSSLEIPVYFIMGNADLRGNLPAIQEALTNYPQLHLLCSETTRLYDSSQDASFDLMGYSFVALSPFRLKDWEKPDQEISSGPMSSVIPSDEIQLTGWSGLGTPEGLISYEPNPANPGRFVPVSGPVGMSIEADLKTLCPECHGTPTLSRSNSYEDELCDLAKENDIPAILTQLANALPANASATMAPPRRNRRPRPPRVIQSLQITPPAHHTVSTLLGSIWLCHTPPWGSLDQIPPPELTHSPLTTVHMGSMALRNQILASQPLVVLSGHKHSCPHDDQGQDVFLERIGTRSIAVLVGNDHAVDTLCYVLVDPCDAENAKRYFV